MPGLGIDYPAQCPIALLPPMRSNLAGSSLALVTYRRDASNDYF
jgi:hypothetical protein